MNTKTAAVQGSGWGWLGYDKGKKRLEVVTTANQDPLLSKSCTLGKQMRKGRNDVRM